jgi:hypothetical protein
MENKNNTYYIASSLGASFLIIFVLGLLIWTYYFDGRIFIAFLSMIYFIYTILNIIYVWMNSSSISQDAYNVLFGSSIYMAVISLGIFIFFMMKYFGTL